MRSRAFRFHIANKTDAPPLKKGFCARHHGSRAHLVHESVMSCIEERKPRIDGQPGGNFTAAGICAHESALKNGEPVIVPKF